MPRCVHRVGGLTGFADVPLSSPVPLSLLEKRGLIDSNPVERCGSAKVDSQEALRPLSKPTFGSLLKSGDGTGSRNG